ncbi:hypothetical protein DOTSEDRAFT_54903 [Dothistroma septosporum NZE10]|uniref:Uncharacterized protein n=1 Tax=Dothistroma septosporum (strain NZE10 / CBS 128990) TaxID=675120 RepID=N1PMD7_DOTSN|nr:hypothetical protein DOTSEDRAFT_54903 [Dothistroma septosporum NZE10]
MSKPAGTTWDFEIFKNTVSDVEKDRILALYLNGELINIDFDKAATDLKSASANSMKVSMSNMWKKIEKAGGKSGVAAIDPTTPVKTPTSGKKRKSKAEMEDKDHVETTPKKKGRKSKKEIAAEVEAKEGEVKEEQDEDEV